MNTTTIRGTREQAAEAFDAASNVDDRIAALVEAGGTPSAYTKSVQQKLWWAWSMLRFGSVAEGFGCRDYATEADVAEALDVVKDYADHLPR